MQEFVPRGAIAFFALLVVPGLIIGFGIYFLMIDKFERNVIFASQDVVHGFDIYNKNVNLMGVPGGVGDLPGRCDPSGRGLHGVINAIVLTTFFAVAFGHATIAFFLKREPGPKASMLSLLLMVAGTLMAAAAMLFLVNVKGYEHHMEEKQKE